MDNLISRYPHVAVFLATNVKTYREILQGILRYSRRHGPWAVQLFEGRENEQKLTTQELRGCSGLIVDAVEKTVVQKLPDLKLPVIVTHPTHVTHDTRPASLNRLASSVVGVVECESAPIGHAAAEFFLERGFRSFAFVGELTDRYWSRQRLEAFASALAERGFTCEAYPEVPVSVRRSAAREQRRLAAWLKSLHKPTALFAAFDPRARQVINACLTAGIAVPQEVAVLSCDNDELVCETSVPSISSIQMTPVQAGYEAAKLLDRAMRGQFHRERTPRIIPYGFAHIIERASTDSIHLGDVIVERALSTIRMNTEVAFTVDELARMLKISRRHLESHFRHTLGHTVHDEIIQTRLNRVKRLLRTTAVPIEEVAALSGFASASHLCAVFKRHTGTTPLKFRHHA